jgi:hypothetical protein
MRPMSELKSKQVTSGRTLSGTWVVALILGFAGATAAGVVWFFTHR